MSKRSAFPHYGDRKKAKLDISRSEHHLPLSQNISSSNKENNCDEWGDDVDEDMLLEASQACEKEQNDISMLPDYNNWKQPASTSTQYITSPSTSKSSFEFKKPSSHHPSTISMHLKNKCNTISSPLPGISTMSRDRHSNLTDELFVSDKIVQGQETDIAMLQLEEKYNKLKTEYSKLSDKLVTKEGEASILRSQYRTLQLANDNLRMDKIRFQEQIQMEHNDKLAALNKEMQNLKTQLDFKDLEIVGVKEKLKLSEANKLRLTQINDICRNNNTVSAYNGMSTPNKAKMTSKSAQTEDKAPFLKLNISCGKGLSMTGHDSILSEYSALNKKVAFNSNTLPGKQDTQDNEQLQVFKSLELELLKLERELEGSAFTSFQDCDERSQLDKSVLSVSLIQLAQKCPLYNGERGVEARRRTGELACALSSGSVHLFLRADSHATREHRPTILDTAIRICGLIEKTPNSYLYSGFLMSLIATFDSLQYSDVIKPKLLKMTKAVLLCKPMPFVTLELLSFAASVASTNNFLPFYCPGIKVGDGMDVDNENTELCYFVLLLKQTEESLSCVKQKRCGHGVLLALEKILQIFAFVNDKCKGDSNCRCECQPRTARVLVRALRDAVQLLERADSQDSAGTWHRSLLAACRGCVQQIYKCVVTDAEWVSRLQTHEGFLSDAAHRMYKYEPSVELTELKNIFQATPEDAPAAYLQRPFMDSFESFCMTD